MKQLIMPLANYFILCKYSVIKRMMQMVFPHNMWNSHLMFICVIQWFSNELGMTNIIFLYCNADLANPKMRITSKKSNNN